MRVTLLADVSDHVRTYASGDVCELPDEQAARWIRHGLAVAMMTEPPSAEPPEAAALDKPEESATLPRARRRG